MLFRYPGGKTKISKIICDRINAEYQLYNCTSYVEPFFGSGAIGFRLLDNNLINNIWINDLDNGIASIWNTILYDKDSLIRIINNYEPKVEDFYNFKEKLLSKNNCTSWTDLEYAFMKIAIHQMSFSGLGSMAGSPIGGKNQLGKDGSPKKYTVDCRWSPKTLEKNINRCYEYLSKSNILHGKCTSLHYDKVLSSCDDESYIYLDPPYYEIGNSLYQHSFDTREHIRLANMLKEKENWLLSYDNSDFIRNLYKWANIEEVKIKYTITNNTNNCQELLISPKGK
jgi:DNA adenine methylase